MMALQARVHGGQVIVALRGELDITGAAAAAEAVVAAVSPGRPVIVDLAGLDYIDCHALTALAAARRRVRRDGGDVLLAAPHGIVLRLLVLTGLDDVFCIYPSVAAAIAAIPVQAPAPAPSPPVALPVPRGTASHLYTRAQVPHATRV